MGGFSINDLFKSMKMSKSKVKPEKIIEEAYAWLETATLLAAVDMEIFSELAKHGPMTHLQIREHMELNPRSTPDFPDTLLAMKLLERDGDGDTALYRCSKETAVYLDKNRPTTYLGTTLKKVLKLYVQWVDHPEMLKDKHQKQQKLSEVEDQFRALADFNMLKAQFQGDASEKEMKVTPKYIIKTAFAFWTSRMLLTACEFGLFTLIESEPGKELPMNHIAKALGLRKSTTAEFLDNLVKSGMLKRKGKEGDPNALYYNTANCAHYLDRNKEMYIGGLMEFFSAYHYAAAGGLVETLQTGDSQLAAKGTEKDFYDALYPHEGAAEGLAGGLMSVMTEASVVFAKTYPLKKYKTALDITVTDREEMIPATQKFIKERWPDVKDRVIPQVHDYLKEPALPKADVISMTMVLLQWGIDTKKMLVRKAFEALPEGGVLVVVDHFIMDDARRYDAFGLRKSLLMFLIHGNQVGGQTGDEVGGRTFTCGEYRSWCLEAGFKRVEMVPLPGQPMPAGVAYK
ncbi:Tetracenomycin polyketide synthesis 8-O-methyl transferase TcmO [Seminavis robusta]|uniref:Tetracenomycin polyketide synthesis 8-O-methyl transferase TcmO n=1 Tax=Seminavis robusta TaxID=568900 RepID=A0A9N8H7A4_9STRA|nr:Tetracenomycin polyketide synthesis 8-O-methyl transferase TcmO [Seminavis robusta]|eukprot:Sro198_g083960.1 Tetracenomycin polyketide synthesis 8-O-methyl transferase TcmO (515) ;mRNA; f:5920-7526